MRSSLNEFINAAQPLRGGGRGFFQREEDLYLPLKPGKNSIKRSTEKPGKNSKKREEEIRES